MGLVALPGPIPSRASPITTILESFAAHGLAHYVDKSEAGDGRT
jgi:hypothetical protein